MAGHIIGFTSVDDEGQEGLELAFDHWLAGEDGAKRVIQDRYGKIVQNVEEIRAMRPGRNLVLSIDLRIQYLAYRELKAAIRDQRAKSGSAIVIDVATGEVLAMVNQPAYNPNDRDQIKAKTYRNRAVTDIVEPGSSMKPFVVAAGPRLRTLQRPQHHRHQPGLHQGRRQTTRGPHEPRRDQSRDLPRQELQHRHDQGGAGARARADVRHAERARLRPGDDLAAIPGESAGLLPHYSHWRPVGISSMSRGYGLSVTPLQLAHAYATVASFGVSRPMSFLRVETPPAGERALDADVARMLVHLLEAVVAPEGGGKQAAIPGYTVAGKTGTAWKATAGGYATDRYLAVFGGIAPASDAAPRGGGGHRRAERRQVLRRRGRRAGVLRRRRRRAAPAGGAARCAGQRTTPPHAARQVATR